MLKIAVLTESFPTISETFIVNHITGLIDLGYEVTIFSRTSIKNNIIHNDIIKYKLFEHLYFEPVVPNNYFLRLLKVFWLFIKKPISLFTYLLNIKALLITYSTDFLNLRLFFSIYPYFNQKKFDFVHCHFGTVANHALIIRDFGLLQGRLVTTFHGFDLTRLDIVKIKHNIYNKLNNECAIFTANSNYTKNLAITYGIKPYNIHIIPVSLDINKFKRTQDYPNDVFRIITVGRLSEMKGIEYSIRAVCNVINNCNKPIEYIIIGQGEQYDYLSKLIIELDIKKSVKLLGAQTQEEIINYMNISSFFLLTGVQASTGHVETQGLVIQEAQAMQLPVIVANVGGVSDGLLDGETGFLVQARALDEIAAKIKFLCENPFQIINMGKKGREFVEKNYDKKIISKKFSKIYK